jgi:hypothetical protein
MSATLSKKSGKGISDGVVSELTSFFHVKPGHEQELRAACERFAQTLRDSGWQNTQKTGLRDWRHVMFDNDRQLLLTTTFETDWDPYINDAIAVIGFSNWKDWIQHTVEGETLAAWIRGATGAERADKIDSAQLEQTFKASASGLKDILQSTQVPATAYFNDLANYTLPQIRKALETEQAFQQVLDHPDAGPSLQQPALAPLLEQASA